MGRSDIAYWIERKPEGRLHQVSIYLVDLTQDQQRVAQMEFRDRSRMTHWTEGKWLAWRTVAGFEIREAAVAEMGRLAEIVSQLFQPLQPSKAPETSVIGYFFYVSMML